MNTHATDLSHPPLPSTLRDFPQRARRGALGFVTGPMARVVFAIPFLVLGLNHFLNTKKLVGIVPEWLGAPTLWVQLTGAALILAAVSFLTRRFMAIAAFGLVALLLTFVFSVHVPGLLDPATRGMSLVNGLKDLALAAGALMALRTLEGDPDPETAPS